MSVPDTRSPGWDCPVPPVSYLGSTRVRRPVRTRATEGVRTVRQPRPRHGPRSGLRRRRSLDAHHWIKAGSGAGSGDMSLAFHALVNDIADARDLARPDCWAAGDTRRPTELDGRLGGDGRAAGTRRAVGGT